MSSDKPTSGRRVVPDGALSDLKMYDGSQMNFGSIRFTNTKAKAAKWAAFATTGEAGKMDDVLSLLYNTWGLPPPPVIISVTGAAGSGIDHIKPKDRAIYTRGLRNAAIQTKAWIVTGGTNMGVMKLVGSMVADTKEDASNDVVCLGIAPWRAVYGHEKMAESSNGKVHKCDDLDPPDPKIRAALEPNHTHFLLVDSPEEPGWGTEIPARVAIEDNICKQAKMGAEMTASSGETPMVLIVMAGGVGTLDTILETLQNKRPVVVLADSGGVATVLYNYFQTKAIPPLSAKFKNGEPENKADVEMYKAKLPIIYELGSDSHNANKTKHLRFFKVADAYADGSANNDLDVEIMEAVLSDCETTLEAIMHAVKWSQPTVIDNQLAISKGVDSAGLVKAFERALIVGTHNDNAEKVVQTLIEYKADAKLVDLNRLFGFALRKNDPYEVIKTFTDEEEESGGMLGGASGMLGALRGGMLGRGGGGGKRTSVVPHGGSGGKGAPPRKDPDGFKVLAWKFEEAGYETHLATRNTIGGAALSRKAAKEARSGLSRTNPALRLNATTLTPSWSDLMMWAVITGEEKLAYLLWKKTNEPMRCAIMASFICRKIADGLGDDALETPGVERMATLYESWAIGVLDEVKDPDVAVQMLTLVPKKKLIDENGVETVCYLWRDSVMDQACQEDAPCKAFVARKNCQYLLTHFWNGDYSSSGAMVPTDTHPLALLLQVVINAFTTLLPFLSLCGLSKAVVDLRLPRFAGERDSDGDGIPDDEDDDDDEWDDDYFTSGGAARGGVAVSAVATVRMQTELALNFWFIPRVKFTFHAVMYLVYIALYMLILCGPNVVESTWSWSWTSGFMYPGVPGHALTPSLVFELILWVYLIGRFIEEVEQARREKEILKYFDDLWNKLDFITVVIMFVCLTIRVLVWVDTATFQFTGGPLYLDVEPGLLAFDYTQRLYLMQAVQVCFSISVILVFLRYFDTLSIFPALGELVTIMIAMLYDGLPIYVILLWSALGFSAAFSALLPQGNLSTEYWLRPFWYSFRAILGDFDISQVYEILGDDTTPNQNVMGFVAVIMLMLYCFLTTIVIVNLMIAQMTQAYERIREESILFRKYRQVDLIREYKDKRSPLPPPFILFHFVYKILRTVLGYNREKVEIEEGFSDYVWMTRAEKLLKDECSYRDKFVQSLLSSDQSDTLSKVSEVHAEQSRMQSEQQRNFEVTTGRFDAIEAKLKKVTELLSPPKLDDPRDGIGLGRPSYVSPSQLVPINYVQDAYGQYANAKGNTPLYPPAPSRSRLNPVQAAPSGVPSSGIPGSLAPSALRSSAPSALAGARENSAYLQSIAGIPVTAYRQPPSLGGGRSGVSQQFDLQLMDAARRVFNYYDRNASGDIDGRELQPALRDLGLVNIDSAQASAILARYDSNADQRLDFVEFTQLLHELREFQTAANQAAADPLRPRTTALPGGGGSGGALGGLGMGAGGAGGVGCGGGYYTTEQIAELQANARRQVQIEERARLDGSGRLASLDAGPPPQ